MTRTAREALLKGARHMVPLVLPAWPFGMLIGVAIAESDVPNLAGFLSSSFMFAGAAQLAAISLLGAGAPALSALTRRHWW